MINMTKFNPEGKDDLTFGDCLRPAMEITDQADAAQYMADYVAHIQRALDKKPRADDLTAAQIASVNIGYFAGYYDQATRRSIRSARESGNWPCRKRTPWLIA